MANKRLSDLQELSAANLVEDDLFYVVDTTSTVLEGKKIKASSIKSFVLNTSFLSSSYASSSLSASYVNPSSVGLVNSASYSLSGSWADRTFFSSLANTASYSVETSHSRFSDTASFLFYNGSRPNGTASFALNVLSSSYSRTASFANSSSYIIYTGVRNGTVYFSVSSSYVQTSSFSNTASYLLWNGTTPNGTASYALKASSSLSSSYVNSSSYSLSASFAVSSSKTYLADISVSSSFLIYVNGVPNGTSSFAQTSSRATFADSSSYLIYDGVTSNGTASYSLYASNSLSSSFSISSSRAERTLTASYALTASYPGLDPNQYKVYGPYNTNDLSSFAVQSSTDCTYGYLKIAPSGASTTIIVHALCDVKVPITTTDTDAASVILKLEKWVSNPSPVPDGPAVPLDTSKPNNYINLSITGAFTLTGYDRQSISLASNASSTVSGSYILKVTAAGASFDANSLSRGVTFFVYTKPDATVTLTTTP
jgi:hypothetical protein